MLLEMLLKESDRERESENGLLLESSWSGRPLSLLARSQACEGLQRRAKDAFHQCVTGLLTTRVCPAWPDPSLRLLALLTVGRT